MALCVPVEVQQDWLQSYDYDVNGNVLWRYGREVDPNNPADQQSGLPNFSNVDFTKSNTNNGTPESAEQSQLIFAQANDTLRSIAQRAYGNADLW